MARRSLLLLLVLGLLAGFLFWSLNGSSAREDRASNADAAVDSASALPAPSEAALQSDGPDLQRASAPQNEETSLNHAIVPAETFRVRVVHGEDSTPAPFAEVLFLDLQGIDQSRLRAQMRLYHDVEKVLEEMGSIYKADAEGIALVPKPAESMWIAARHNQRYGTVWGAGRANLGEELEIRLLPVIHVCVHVEDETGVPLAGLTVGYLSGADFEAQLSAETPTDERGNAELRHLETLITTYARGRRNRIVAALPGTEPPGVDFALESPPREVVRIVVPRCGSVRVQVLGLAGQPAPEGTPVTLQPALTPEQQAAWREIARGRPLLGRRDGFGAQIASTQDGSARFPHVPIGLRLECFASPDWSMFQEAVEAEGPQRPGEETVILLRQSGVHPLLTGRLVDAAGTPIVKVSLVSTDLHGWPDQAGARRSMALLETDADGRFTKVLEEAVVPPGTARILAIYRTLDADSRLQMAWIFVPEKLSESGLDVGDLALGGPIAVAGRVERADGSPVAGAWLSLMMQLAPPESIQNAGTRQVEGPLWLTNEDGRFSLEGLIPGATHHLQVHPQDGGQSVYQPFALGTTDLRIVLAETGSIKGRVLLDPGIPGDLLYVDYGPASFAEGEDPWGRQGAVDRLSGAFDLHGLKPGSWNLSLGLSTSTEPLLTIEDVVIPPGGSAAEDARLQIDLRGKLHLHRLIVLDADGGRPGRIELQVFRDGGWQSSRLSNPCDFVATEPTLRAVVGAEGWGQTEVTLPGGEVQVRLGRGIPVRIELAGEGLTAGVTRMRLLLYRKVDRSDLIIPYFYREKSVTPPWSWNAVVPAAGSYVVTAYLNHEGEDHGAWYGNDPPVLIQGLREFPIQVGAGPAEQVFRLEISSEAVTHAQAAAQER